MINQTVYFYNSCYYFIVFYIQQQPWTFYRCKFSIKRCVVYSSYICWIYFKRSRRFGLKLYLELWYCQRIWRTILCVLSKKKKKKRYLFLDANLFFFKLRTKLQSQFPSKYFCLIYLKWKKIINIKNLCSQQWLHVFIFCFWIWLYILVQTFLGYLDPRNTPPIPPAEAPAETEEAPAAAAEDPPNPKGWKESK